MTHGTPDWGHTRSATVYPLVNDLGEVAARLGSITTYDRRGNVIWFDDFSKGLAAWIGADAGGTGGSCVLSPDEPEWPPFSAKLTAGRSANGWARLVKYLAPPVAGRLGIEISVNFKTQFDYFQMFLQFWDGTTTQQGSIFISDTDSKIYYLDADNNRVELGAITSQILDIDYYNSLKLVVDFSTTEYVRFLLNRVSYDMSGIELYNWVGGASPQMWLYMIIWSRSGENDYCYVDAVIATQNEP